jgi:hypothetical protein
MTEIGAEYLQTIALPDSSLVAGSHLGNINSFVFLVILMLSYFYALKEAYRKIWVCICQSSPSSALAVYHQTKYFDFVCFRSDTLKTYQMSVMTHVCNTVH